MWKHLYHYQLHRWNIETLKHVKNGHFCPLFYDCVLVGSVKRVGVNHNPKKYNFYFIFFFVSISTSKEDGSTFTTFLILQYSPSLVWLSVAATHPELLIIAPSC